MSAPGTALERNLRCLHLSQVSDAAKTALALREAGIDPVLVNAHPTRAFPEITLGHERARVAFDLHARLRFPLGRYARYAFALSPRVARFALVTSGTGRALERLRSEVGPIDFVLAHWGTGVLPELALLKHSRAFGDVPAILNFETYPTAWTSGRREHLERLLLERASRWIDGCILPTRAMATLVEAEAPELLERPHRVAPFYFPACFQGGDDPPETALEEPGDVVFTGWLDLTKTLNDVRPQLLALADAGLHVHCTRAEGLDHPNVHFFEHFPGEAFNTGGLAAFVRQFKASLVSHRVDPRPASARFETSLPSRFLFTLAAGVPVLVPRGRFPAMERVVSEHGVGLAYGSAEEAARRLGSPDWSEVQKRAFEARGRFLFDAAGFRQFLAELVPPRSNRRESR